MKLRFFIFILACAGIFKTAIAQENPVKSIGKVISVNVEDQTINITTNNAFARITVYSANVIRVRIDKHKLASDFSYAIIAQPQKTKTSITQNAQEIDVTTDSLKAVIKRSPFAITFYNNNGDVISQDETGFGLG